MESNSIILEAKVFYRLVKVLYIFSLSVILLAVLFLGWQKMPYQSINDKKSYLICPDLSVYSLRDLNIYIYSDRTYSDYGAERAAKACNKPDQIKKEFIEIELPNGEIWKFPESLDEKYIKKQMYKHFPEYVKKVTEPGMFAEIEHAMSDKKNQKSEAQIDWAATYPTHWVYETIGSWGYVIKFWFFGFTITFLILSGIKQSVLYIVYGKKFTLGILNIFVKKLQDAVRLKKCV